MNEVKALTEKLIKRINSIGIAGKPELIEIDIIQDLLKQVYLLVDDLKSEIISQPAAHIEQSQPESQQIPEPESPVIESVKSDEFQEPLQTQKFQELIQAQEFKEPVQPHEVQKPVQPHEMQEPLKPAAHFIEEVPVMTFPKVEVSLNPEKVIEPTYKEPERIQPSQTQQEQERIQPVQQQYEPERFQTLQPQPEPERVQPTQKQYEPERIQQPQGTNTQRQPERPVKSSAGKTSASSDLFGGQTIADKLKSETPSLNDRITQGRVDQSLAHKMQLKPISDLKTAIGINEKFQFVNDLFEGRIELYNEAINNLNNCNSDTSAQRLLEDLKAAHNWKEETEAYNKLKTFINRRYI